MKEVRLHGRGGQGVVKGAQILVRSVIEQGRYAHFIPFFGVERKGSPVYGFVRLGDQAIRLKTQVYNPHCLIVLDDTLLDTLPIFEGLRGDSIVIINSKKSAKALNLPDNIKKLGIVDATGIAINIIGRAIPNTSMLGAFARVTGWLDSTILFNNIEASFGPENTQAAQKAYEQTCISGIGGVN